VIKAATLADREAPCDSFKQKPASESGRYTHACRWLSLELC
jgi:hypothetical protein